MGRYNVRDWFRDHITAPDAGEAEVGLWRAWFAAHGIDPDGVLLTEWVERRIAPNGVVCLEAGTRDDEPITVERAVLLDEPPEPFPVP